MPSIDACPAGKMLPAGAQIREELILPESEEHPIRYIPLPECREHNCSGGAYA